MKEPKFNIPPEEEKIRKVIDDMLPDEEHKITIKLTPEFYKYKKELKTRLRDLEIFLDSFTDRLSEFVNIR